MHVYRTEIAAVDEGRVVTVQLSETQKTRVLSLQTPLLGNQTYGMLLRRAFRASTEIEFDAHWSTEAYDESGQGRLERQLDRLFLKMMTWGPVRARNLDFFPLRYELGTSFWARRTLNKLLRKSQPHVLHIHTQAIALLSLDVIARIPTIISADGTSIQMASQQLPKAWRWTFIVSHALERLVLRKAAAVVTFSQWAANSMIADHGVDADRVHVIPPGIDVMAFATRQAHQERSTPLRILFVGGEFERKGGPLLAHVFLSHFAADENIELHVVTKSPSVPKHPRIIVHLGVTAYSEEWHNLYQDADVFVMPTKRDQSPIVFLEAMAAGLPVVTTPVGSAAEVIVDGVTGFIVEPDDEAALADRITRLLRQAALRERMGAAGRERVIQNYEARRNARAFERLLVSVAQGP